MNRRAWRFVFFALAILAGFAAGLGYGWAINPVRSVDTRPDMLRGDYRTDFVLMTAELYHAEGDLPMALARLSFLGDTHPLNMLNEAIDDAQTRQYAPADLQLMLDLAADIDLMQGRLD